MAAFKQGELHLLVATTVIEVGVDVPNASLMIIENGELLGTRQTGTAEFKVADLLRDQAIIPEVQRIARHIHERYPQQAVALIERWMPETERYSNA